MKNKHTSIAFACLLSTTTLGMPAAAQSESSASSKVDVEKFKLGQRIFDGKHDLKPQRMNNKDYKDQQARLVALHQALPKAAQKNSPLPTLVGRLAPEEEEALSYYLQLKYHATVEAASSSGSAPEGGSGSGGESKPAVDSPNSGLPIKLDMGQGGVDADRYKHGLRVFRKSQKFSTRTLSDKEMADQREYVLWLHNVLPDEEKKHSPLPELVGRLTDEDIDALHYYLVLKYKVPVERKAE